MYWMANSMHCLFTEVLKPAFISCCTRRPQLTEGSLCVHIRRPMSDNSNNSQKCNRLITVLLWSSKLGEIRQERQMEMLFQMTAED